MTAKPAAMQVAVKAFIVESTADECGWLLMVRYKTSGNWDLPGGRLESHDIDLDEALAREVKEETGLTVHGPGRPLATFLATHPGNHQPCLHLIQEVAGNGNVTIAGQTPEDCIERAEWIPLGDVPGLQLDPYMRRHLTELVGGHPLAAWS